MWTCDPCTFSGCLMEKLEKSDKVIHNIPQTANVVAVATVFISLWTLLNIQAEKGASTVAKSAGGGLYASGGIHIIAGFYGTVIKLH